MAQDAVSPGRGGVRAGRFDQLTTTQLAQGHLHRAFRQARSFRDRAQTLRDRSPVRSLACPIKMKVDEKSARLLIVPDQITHQDVQDIVIDRDSPAETWHLSDLSRYTD